MFADFYGCDIILASPLGLRRSIEKEGSVFSSFFSTLDFLFTMAIRPYRNADYLTSIELLVIDQMDTLTMQNWEHVKVCPISGLILLPSLSVLFASSS
jgi:U3 small nucleolar RNA-associated protein 25